MLRTLWRRTGKYWLQQGRQWQERQRYPQLFEALETADQAGLRIEAALRQGTPFCAGRMGHVEARLLGEWRLRRGRWSHATRLEAHTNAGVVPVSDAGLEAFARTYHQALEQVDLLGFWQTDHQAALVSALQPLPELCPLFALETFASLSPRVKGSPGAVCWWFTPSGLRSRPCTTAMGETCSVIPACCPPSGFRC